MNAHLLPSSLVVKAMAAKNQAIVAENKTRCFLSTSVLFLCSKKWPVQETQFTQKKNILKYKDLG